MKKIIGWTAVYLFVVVLSACDPEEVWINDITFKSATLDKAGDKPEYNYTMLPTLLKRTWFSS